MINKAHVIFFYTDFIVTSKSFPGMIDLDLRECFFACPEIRKQHSERRPGLIQW
jgi:hypothetical protein